MLTGAATTQVTAQVQNVALSSDHNILKILLLFFFNFCMYALKLSHHSTSNKDLSETQQTAFKLCYLPLTDEFPPLYL